MTKGIRQSARSASTDAIGRMGREEVREGKGKSWRWTREQKLQKIIAPVAGKSCQQKAELRALSIFGVGAAGGSST